jgi:DNA-binding transcriptional LysR family regulator
MVAAGGGVALVPATARHIRQPGVVFAPLSPSAPNLEMAVAWRRDNTSPIVAQFIAVARRALVRPKKRSGASGLTIGNTQS